LFIFILEINNNEINTNIENLSPPPDYFCNNNRTNTNALDNDLHNQSPSSPESQNTTAPQIIYSPDLPTSPDAPLLTQLRNSPSPMPVIENLLFVSSHTMGLLNNPTIPSSSSPSSSFPSSSSISPSSPSSSSISPSSPSSYSPSSTFPSPSSTSSSTS
jgi:hypothetical protein